MITIKGKFIFLKNCVCMIIFSMAIIGNAYASVITITPSSSRTSVGTNFHVFFAIENFSDNPSDSLSAFDINVLFDPKFMLLTGISFSDPTTSRNQLEFSEPEGLSFTSSLNLESNNIDIFGLSGNSQTSLDLNQKNAFNFTTLTFQALSTTLYTSIDIDITDPNLLFIDSSGVKIYPSYTSMSAVIEIGARTDIAEPHTFLLIVGGALAAWLSLYVKPLAARYPPRIL